MQTFLPHYCALDIARCLDNKRLNKQILECDVLLDLHLGIKDNQWKNHPAFKMWVNDIDVLLFYRNTMLEEWMYRGFKSNRDFRHDVDMGTDSITYPWFMSDDRVILSHRSNLVRKLPEHYGSFGWHDYGVDGYYWPCEVKTPRSKKINKFWEETVNG